MPYEVSTPVFEGPFDLLLHLILREEVDLWQISLVHLVDVFCVEVENMERVDLDVATEFLLIAATLVELKARRMLPGREDVDLDEELMRFEERDLLLARLLECKTFQDAARVMNERLQSASRSVARTAGPEEPFRSLAPDPLERVALEALLVAARRGLAPPEPVEEVQTTHIAPIRASVRDAIDTVLALLPGHGPVRFRELTYGVTEKLEIIVRFLAVLELFKQGVVDLEQIESFGELTVRPLAAGERVALDLSSLEEWGDEPMIPERVQEQV
ncbi:MAG: segregation and condensation protein [Actinomycetota bacterium]|nr:segregation and condensation protein [Actinomycetota bacterium]